MILDQENEQYIRWQRSDLPKGPGIIDVYKDDIDRDYESIKFWIPPHIENFVDIGCGVGGLALKIALETGAEAHLIDGDGKIDLALGGKLGGSGYYEEYLTYSNRALIAKNFRDNGLGCHIYNPGPELKIKADLVISTLSCGFHYPVSTYQNMFDHLDSGSIVILDIRLRYEQDLGPDFEEVGRTQVKRWEGTKYKADRICWRKL